MYDMYESEEDLIIARKNGRDQIGRFQVRRQHELTGNSDAVHTLLVSRSHHLVGLGRSRLAVEVSGGVAASRWGWNPSD